MGAGRGDRRSRAHGAGRGLDLDRSLEPNGAASRKIEYVLDSDETLVVLNGSGELRVDHGDPISLRPGVVIALPRGCHLSWLVDEDFRELWIYS